MTPKVRVIGAAIAMVQAITTRSCTCWTSLVIRVMSDGAPKAPTSRAEKSVTVMEHGVADVAAEAHGHLGAQVHGHDREADLDEGEAEHRRHPCGCRPGRA